MSLKQAAEQKYDHWWTDKDSFIEQSSSISRSDESNRYPRPPARLSKPKWRSSCVWTARADESRLNSLRTPIQNMGVWISQEFINLIRIFESYIEFLQIELDQKRKQMLIFFIAFLNKLALSWNFDFLWFWFFFLKLTHYLRLYSFWQHDKIKIDRVLYLFFAVEL